VKNIREYSSPNTARFLSEDPIEFLSGDFNFYRYVGNNPVNYTGLSGFIATSVQGATKSSQQILSNTMF
jgi:uncharacterized protein RhaS with RHS repeats